MGMGVDLAKDTNKDSGKTAVKATHHECLVFPASSAFWVHFYVVNSVREKVKGCIGLKLEAFRRSVLHLWSTIGGKNLWVFDKQVLKSSLFFRTFLASPKSAL